MNQETVPESSASSLLLSLYEKTKHNRTIARQDWHVEQQSQFSDLCLFNKQISWGGADRGGFVACKKRKSAIAQAH